MKILKNNKIIKIISSTLFIFLFNLSSTFAQDNALQYSQNFKETANNLTNNVLTSAVTLLITAAFVVFFWGVVIFIWGRATGKGDMADLKKGKEFMIWGLVALFIMVSVWGIIKLAQDVLDIKSSNIEIQAVSFSPISNSNLSANESNSNTTSNPKNPLQIDSGGVTRENPFANTDIYPVIKEGYNNVNYLNTLTNMLRSKKCYPTTDMGTTYDSKDSHYVKIFQKINGISEDGIVGADTWEALSVSTGMKTTFTGILVKDCPAT